MNIEKSKVMRCSRYGNMGRMNARLNGEPLDEVDFYYVPGVASDSKWRL